MISEIFFIPMFLLPRPITWAKSSQSAIPALSMRHLDRVFGRLPLRTYVNGALEAHADHAPTALCGS